MSKKPSAASSTPHVLEVDSNTFAHEVIERSLTVPVIVDFWAPWCGPCKMISPVLEKLAQEFDGRFVLAKVNIDECSDIASEFGVRSIPAVFAVRAGEVIDAFVGVQPESVIRTWTERMMPSEAESLTVAAHDLESSDPKAAAAKYSRALELDADLSLAQIGLARLALAQGQVEDAAAWLAALERRGFLEPEAERLKAELTFRAQAKGTGGVEAARTALAARPDDLTLKFALAEALASAGQYADALAICLELVERDRKGVGEKARQTMVAIFQLLPPGDELVMEYQRQLSLVL